ncbi:MAG: HAD family hydrolase [Opitutales bacterium]
MDFTRIRAFIFDMDGLMLDTERIALAAWTQAVEEVGVDLPEGFFVQLIGKRTSDSQQLIRDQLGETAPVDALWASWGRHFEAHVEGEPIPTKPGLHGLLDFLERRRFPKIVATSTGGPRARRHLSDVGLLERFEDVVSGRDVALGKPAPDIFLRAAQVLAIEPAHCLVLEDSGPGIEGAHAAGMLPVLIPDLHAPSPEQRSLAAFEFPWLGAFQAAFASALDDQEAGAADDL